MHPLKAVWDELTARYTDGVEHANTYWWEIEKSYSRSNRYYHNLSHIQYMTDLALQWRERLNNVDLVLFSIFYHDIVYNPMRKDNEERSATMAAEHLSTLEVNKHKIDVCRDQIMATQDHKCGNDNDTCYLVDFDLAILGEDSHTYATYTENIRREYSIYPDFLYRKGRKKVLQHFLGMERIFKTEEFYLKYEKRARENLISEMLKLK